MTSDVSSSPQDGAATDPGSTADTGNAQDTSSDTGAAATSSNGGGQDSSAATGNGSSTADSSSAGAGQDSSTTTDSGDSGSAGQSASDSGSGASTADPSSASTGSGDSGSAGQSASDSSSGGSTADSSSAGAGQDSSASTDSGASGSGQSASTDSGGDSAAKSSNGGTGGDSSNAGSGGDQTPAKDLTMDTIQPASTAADSNLRTAGATSASSDGSAAVPTAEGVSVSDIIAIGTTAVKIMAASSPDYSMKNNPISVLPRGVDPLALSGVVADPHELRITLNLHNRATMLIVNLPVVVQWRYGGSSKGAGRYITSASVFLDSGADVGVFYKADVDASLTGPWNAGSDGAPVAAISVMVDVKVTDKISPYGRNIVLDGSIQGDGAGSLRQRPDA